MNTTFSARLSNAKKLFEKTNEDDHGCGMTRSPIRPTKQGDALDGSFLPMMSCSYLYLSGTLFRSLNNGEVHRGADFQLDILRRISKPSRLENEGARRSTESARCSAAHDHAAYRMLNDIQRIVMNTDSGEFDPTGSSMPKSRVAASKPASSFARTMSKTMSKNG